MLVAMRLAAACTLLLVIGCGRQDGLRIGDGTDAQANVQPDGAAHDSGPLADAEPTPMGRDGGRFLPDGARPQVRDAGLLLPGDGGPTPRADGGRPFRDGGRFRDSGGPPTPDTGLRRDAAVGTPDTGVRQDAGQVADSGVPGCTSDRDCAFGGARGFCEPTTRQCVECLQDNDCSRFESCDTSNGWVCRVSCFNGRCPPNQTCDPATDTCVGCLNDMDCGSDYCSPTTRQCVECVQDSHCAGQVARPLCDGNRNECVGCRNDGDCTPPQTCEQQRRQCVAATGRALCEPCDDDDQCGTASDLCLGFRFGPGQFLDRTCAQDCSNSACPRGYECIDTRSNSARQCRPTYAMRNPTCEAVRHLGESCMPSSGTSDPGCGLSNLQDARCEPDPSGAAVCTYWCDSDDDCVTGASCVGATTQDPGNCF